MEHTNDFNVLLQYLAQHGGKIVSSNSLDADLIAQAQASNRMYVDENSLGYVWEPPVADKFPVTVDEVKMYEWCYPLEVHLPEHLKNLTFTDADNPANTTDSVPRRAKLYMLTTPEKAIYNAVMEVEKIGADVRLTNAVNLLQQAKELVADFVDDVPPKAAN
ncbi:MAG: hypothetical protein V4538_01720 [Bacteroidota bacterium]